MLVQSGTQQRFRQMIALVIATTACGILAACSTDTQSSDPATASASPGVSRQAGLYRQSQVCVVNDSPNIITVNFSQKDSSSGEGVIQPQAGTNGQACAQGWFAFKFDVMGSITTIRPDSTLNFEADNVSMKPPLFQASSPPSNQTCLGWNHASVGDTDTWDNGILKYTAVRQPDSSDYINFTVTVTGTQDPSLDGVARTTC